MAFLPSGDLVKTPAKGNGGQILALMSMKSC
jgi:hypothetical protein